MAYRVKDWATKYENNRTRELKRLEWVPVPNKMDGAGYTELVDHPNGAAHLGAWLAILEIASRQEKRGDIPQASTGVSAALARISRLPAVLFGEVLPRLEAIGWIECVAECDEQAQKNQEHATIPQVGAGIPQDAAALPQVGAGLPALKGMEGKGMEGKKPSPASPPADAAPKPPSALELAIQDAAERIHLTHPKRRRDCSSGVVAVRLRAAVTRHCKGKGYREDDKIRFVQEIQRTHAAKCRGMDWLKDGGEYAKSLENWLAPTMDRYLPRAPESAYDPMLPLLLSADMPGHMNPGLLRD